MPEHLDDTASDAAAPAAKPGGPLRFARMTGSSIAGRDAAGWVTDFLNAAYYRRPVGRTRRRRSPVGLRHHHAPIGTGASRPAACALTDLRAFHGAYGRQRFDTQSSGRGLLNREQLLDGAVQLLGDWFPEAYVDGARRGLGNRLSNGR